MLKQTPLNALHRRLGAKMVDFGGWDMPLHYGSQIEEHRRVRGDAGMFDVSHMRVVDVRGPAARDFLRWLLANNVDRLKLPGKALYTCLLDASGGVLDDLIAYFRTEQWFRLVVNAATAEKDVSWMRARRDERFPGLEVDPRGDLALIAVQGPHARAKLWKAMPGARVATEALAPFQGAEAGECFIARTGYTGEDGFEVMLPAAEAPELWEKLRAEGVAPAGLGARDTLRLEAGMNLYGQDMDESVTPLESGLGWTVDLASPREFVGKQALLARPPLRQLMGLLLLDRGVLRAHQRVESFHGAGEVTSGTFSPTLEQSIALARIPGKVVPGEEVQVEVRERLLRARAVKPPFVRHGKVLV